MTNAGLLRRMGAIFYDSMLLLALMFFATLPFVAVSGGEPVGSGDTIHQLILLLVAYAFFVGFWSRAGRTLGMQSRCCPGCRSGWASGGSYGTKTIFAGTIACPVPGSGSIRETEGDRADIIGPDPGQSQ